MLPFIQKRRSGFSLCILGIFLTAFVIGIAASDVVVVYAEKKDDGRVYVNAYTSNGKALPKALIKVLDQEGVKILEGLTDSFGEFDFKTPKVPEIKILLLTEDGRKSEFQMKTGYEEKPKPGVPANDSTDINR